MPKKGALTVSRFKRGLGKNKASVFDGVDTLMHTILSIDLTAFKFKD